MFSKRMAAVIVPAVVALGLAVPVSPAQAAPDCDGPNPPPICSEEPPPQPGDPYGTVTFYQFQTDVNVYGNAGEPNGGAVRIDVTVDGALKGTFTPNAAGWYSGAVPVHPTTATVCATARNSVNTRTQLGCYQVHGPVGHLDVSFVGSTTVMTGWVIDPDSTEPVTLFVPPNGYYQANQARSDVAAQYPAYGPYHGFTIVFQNYVPYIDIIALNAGPGTDTYLNFYIG